MTLVPPNPVKKYVLCPGIVVSTFDGEHHYIGAPELARLYKVSMAECIVWTPDEPVPAHGRIDDLIILAPDVHGVYEVPK